MSQTRRILFLFFTALTLGAADAYRVHGRVTDSSGDVVTKALLKFYSRDSTLVYATKSDAQGNYSLAISTGEYLIEAEAPGLHLPGPPRTVLVRTDQDLPLQLGVATLSSSVVVTATGTSQSLTETGKALDVVERAEWEQRGIESAVDGLRELPGLRLSQRGGPGSFATIQTRGLRTFDTAILIDGMRFRDAGSPQARSSVTC